MLLSMTATFLHIRTCFGRLCKPLIALGGSASIAELDAAVIDREQFSPEVSRPCCTVTARRPRFNIGSRGRGRT